MGWTGHVARMGTGELHTEFERRSQSKREKFIRRKAKHTRHDYKTNEDILSDTKINTFVKKNSKLHK
jgi:hypothetical protein